MKFQSDKRRMTSKTKNLGRCLLIVLLLCLVTNVQGQVSSSTVISPNQNIPDSFLVKTIQIQGNTLLSESKLLQLVDQLIDSEQTLDALKKGAEAIQKMYRDAGYGGVVAFIPEQKLSDGNVVIQILEGKLTAVQISGNENLNEATLSNDLST